MNEEQAKRLREAFPPEHIGKLPKGGGVILDYVGHGAVTDRLLEVDPDWNWEPVSVDEHGFPRLDADGNLWIRLTVAGTTRLGVGDGATMKVLIGDALRNAAMRFGVALDLWIRGHAEDDEQQTPTRPRQAAQVPSEPLASQGDHHAIRQLIASMTDAERPGFLAWWKDQGFPSIKTRDALTGPQAETIYDKFDELAAADPDEVAAQGSAGGPEDTPPVDAPGTADPVEQDDPPADDTQHNLHLINQDGMLHPDEEDKVRTGGGPADARRALTNARRGNR